MRGNANFNLGNFRTGCSVNSNGSISAPQLVPVQPVLWQNIQDPCAPNSRHGTEGLEGEALQPVSDGSPISPPLPSSSKAVSEVMSMLRVLGVAIQDEISWQVLSQVSSGLGSGQLAQSATGQGPSGLGSGRFLE